jgi:hypothetical protein
MDGGTITVLLRVFLRPKSMQRKSDCIDAETGAMP